MGKLKSIFHKLEMAVIVIPLFFLCILIVAQVIMRFLFDEGIHWLEEFGRYVLVYSTFIGASIAIRSNEHPRMTAILIALPHKAKHAVYLLGDLICAFILAVLDYYAWIQVMNVFRWGTRTSTLPLPMWIIYAIFPVTLIAMSIRFIISAKNNFILLIKPDEGEKGDEVKC